MSLSGKFISQNPYTGEILSEINFWDEAHINQALDQSETAFAHWSAVSFEEKRIFLSSLSTYLKQNVSHFAHIITAEMGKPLDQSKAEVLKSASLCDYYFDHLEELVKDRLIYKNSKLIAKVLYQPQGAVLGIMPWNFPVWQAIRFAIPVLAGGNVVLLKHAQNVGLTALEIQKAIDQCSPVKNILISVLSGHESIPNILKHPHVAGVSLTGSERAGAAVGSVAGQLIKKSVMELGGSDPFIVMADADLDIAVQHAVRGRLNNNGQTCIAAKRFIVESSVYDHFLEKFSDLMAQKKVGSPLDLETDVSGLARKDLSDQLSGQVKRTVDAGATKILKGGQQDRNPTIYYPEILVDIPKGSAGDTEELFGPVATVYNCQTIEDIILKANDTAFGLGATVFSKDLDRAHFIAGKLQNGSVSINKMLSSDPFVPFGGMKRSGFGREMSSDGFYEFLNLKSVVADYE